MDTPRQPIWAQPRPATSTTPTPPLGDPRLTPLGEPPVQQVAPLGEPLVQQTQSSAEPKGSYKSKVAALIGVLGAVAAIIFGIQQVNPSSVVIESSELSPVVATDNTETTDITDTSEAADSVENVEDPTGLGGQEDSQVSTGQDGAATETPIRQGPESTSAEPVADAAATAAPAVVLITHQSGQGSGIIYDEGLVMTNAHVVGNAQELTLQLASGVKVMASVVGSDTQTDVAVLSFETEEPYTIATFAGDETVQVGQLAVAIGSPFGLEQTVTAGIVSAVGRVVTGYSPAGEQTVVAMLQTDAPINPGNSGGALVDRHGHVVGMNTSIQTDGSGGNIGVGFAIPSDTAVLIAQRIENGESLESGFLGVETRDTTLGEPGVVLAGVIDGGGAQAAGIEAGDLLVSFEGNPIRTTGDLVAAVWLQTPGTEVDVEVLRDGQRLPFTVTLGSRPAN